MKIHGLTVCVRYADYLARGIDRWLKGLSSLTVVTDLTDQETFDLASSRNPWVTCIRTDLFYRNGALFNKGAAMEHARAYMPWSDWWLLFDADIVPEADWAVKVAAQDPKPYILHSAWRRQCAGPEDIDRDSAPRIEGDGVGVGYFQLFHTADPAVHDRAPLVETHWAHAGNYDNGFMNRWPHQLRRLLPIKLWHQGQRDSWCGRGNDAAFSALMAERKRRGGAWDHERIR